MDLFDDYQGEVERLTPEQIEAVLSGEDHSSRPLATLIQDVRVVLLEDPAPEITVRHLAAMSEAADASRESARPAPVPSIRALPRRRGAAVALAAALLLVAGIAAAVTIPKEAARPDSDSVPSIGPSLAAPTSPAIAPGSSAEGTHGQEVSGFTRNTDLTGCEKGQAVAEVASGKAAEKRNNSSPETDPCSRAGSQGKPQSGGPDDIPAGPGGGFPGREGSQAVGGPSAKGGQSLGTGARDQVPASGGGSGAGVPRKSGADGGIPDSLPTP